MTVKSNNPETMVLHAGPPSDLTTGAVAVPIFQTTSCEFRSTEHAANLFALKEFGNIYSRIMNSTCDTLEQKMAALEGGASALPFSFGQAPSALAIQSLCRPGDNAVSSTGPSRMQRGPLATTRESAPPCRSSVKILRKRWT
jgi:O-acetylhomoserine (thiol)-lyase